MAKSEWEREFDEYPSIEEHHKLLQDNGNKVPSSFNSAPQQDPDYMKEFNSYQDHKEEKPNEETSSIGAFLRSAGRGPYDLAENLGVPHDKLIYPQFIHEKPGDIQHPIAKFAGSSVWGGPILKELGLLGKVAQGFKGIKNIGQLHQDAARTEEAANQAKTEQQQFADLLQSRYGKSKIPSIQRALNEAHAKQLTLQEKYPNEQALSQQEPTDLSNRLPGATGEHLLPQAQNQTRLANRETSQYLGRGNPEPHDVMYQNIMNQMIRGNRAELSRGYNQLGQTFENRNITLPRTRDINEAHQELRRVISEGGLDSPEARALAHDLSSSENQDIPAADMLRQFRSADKLSKLASRKSFERNENLTEEQRNNFRRQAHEYRTQANRLQDILERDVDPQFASTLQNLNRGWRQYASLYENPLARKIESGRGISGNNILEQMRGDDIGQQLLRELTRSHPEAQRSAIGHTYAEHPDRLLNASPYEQGFIDQNPNLTGMIQRMRQAQQNEQIARQQAAARQEEAARAERAYQEDVQKEQAKSQARQYAHQIEQYEKIIPELERQASNVKSTMEEKVRAALRLEKAQKDLQRIKKAGIGLALFIGYEVLDKATKTALNIILKK